MLSGVKVAGAHELEPLAGLGIGQAFFQLGVVNDLHAVGVQVILEVSAIGNAVHVSFGKQLVVQVDLSIHAVLAADPMDGAAHLAAIGGVAVAGFQVSFGMDGHHVAGFVLIHTGAAHQVSTHQADFAAQGQALELRRGNLKEIALVDPDFLGKGNRAGGGIVGVTVGVVGQIKILDLVSRVVVDHQLDRLQNGNAAGGVQLQLGAQHGFQLAHIHQAVCFGNTGGAHKLKNAGGGVAAAAQTAQGGHAGVIPAVHNVLFHQFTQVALAHDGVGHVQAGKFALFGEAGTKNIGHDPLIQGAVVLEFQAAHGMGDALNGVLNGVGKVIQG